MITAVVVAGRAQDVEVLVEVDVDLAAVGARDLDLVGAFLVAGLGLGDLAVAGVCERRGARPLECLAAYGRVGRVVVAATAPAMAAPPAASAATAVAAMTAPLILRSIWCLLGSG